MFCCAVLCHVWPSRVVSCVLCLFVSCLVSCCVLSYRVVVRSHVMEVAPCCVLYKTCRCQKPCDWRTVVPCCVLTERVAVRSHVMEVVTVEQLCLVSSQNVPLSEAMSWYPAITPPAESKNDIFIAADFANVDTHALNVSLFRFSRLFAYCACVTLS